MNCLPLARLKMGSLGEIGVQCRRGVPVQPLVPRPLDRLAGAALQARALHGDGDADHAKPAQQRGLRADRAGFRRHPRDAPGSLQKLRLLDKAGRRWCKLQRYSE